MVDYELMDETNGMRYGNSCWRILALVLLYLITTTLVFLSWNSAYNDTLQYPPLLIDVPHWWYRRAHSYANSAHEPGELSHDFRLVKNQTLRLKPQYIEPEQNLSTEVSNKTGVQGWQGDDNFRAFPQDDLRLVCYYTTPNSDLKFTNLQLKDINATVCTHINVGVADVHNLTIYIPEDLEHILRNEVPILRSKNPKLKFLLWIGGGDVGHGFQEMVSNHSTRKVFLQSMKRTLHEYSLDGIDLDWEFPSAYNKERQHFSQLLYEIRQEYRREHRDYMLSIAVAAPEGIALFAYDVLEINKYADYVNLMCYDYHFYSHETPFTGLNAPLYARGNEHSILATLNINYSVNWWLTNGLERKKLVVGLPTYGHSFTLVNPFNNRIGAPAEGIGRCGSQGFTAYSEICWFISHNPIVSVNFDIVTCSPWLSSGTEWISFENEKSIECKTRYIKSLNLGGVMIYSLNTDDYHNFCNPQNMKDQNNQEQSLSFPLIKTVKRILSSSDRL